MHDTHLLKSILKYLKDQEDLSSRKIKKIFVSISEFGSLNKEHFLEHYKQAICGTEWQGLEAVVDVIPFGPELEITGLEFAAPGLIGEAGTRI
ncbi:MAG: hypothetical protein PHC71_01770 [Candidatus Omnitrophica bacterium]|nr:hypothetical protein [Candidatus Omnitrophota bacterium]